MNSTYLTAQRIQVLEILRSKLYGTIVKNVQDLTNSLATDQTTRPYLHIKNGSEFCWFFSDYCRVILEMTDNGDVQLETLMSQR